MKKRKFDIFKFLSMFLISIILIGYFPKIEVIADTVKATQNNADYLGNVSFYNYYGKYQTSDTTDSSDGDHYSFERFNRAISNYASSTAMEYPLYFGDFNGAANNSNNPEQNPLQGQTLGGSAYRFYWAINRANRNANYSASLQGIVNENLDSQGYITQSSTGGFIITDENSKKYEYTNENTQMISNGNRWIKNEDVNGRTGSLQVWLQGKQDGTPCERIKISADEKDYLSNSNYLTFEIYNIGKETSGSPYVSIEDGNGNKIGGWSEYFNTQHSDNKMPTKSTGWKRIIVDLNKLKGNNNFDFSNIANMYLGYWADGSNENHFYINDIRFIGELEESVVKLPYFDENFVSGNVGETISDLKFPFKKRLKTENGLDTYYYTFSSGKSGYKVNNNNITDVVRINRSTNNLDYWFDVNDNDNSIIVRDMNGTNGWGTGKNEPGFFPFNSPGDSSSVSKLNYGFGAKVEIQFKLTADGKVKNIHGNDVPIEFNFKGDDDVWVYIDNKLALDMGGAHSQTTGKIDFASKKSTVDNVVIGDLKSNSLYQPVKSVTTDLKLADDSYTIEGKYDTNKIHTLTLFYMERGMIESNLYMDFNFIPSDNELIVEKEVDVFGVNEALTGKTTEIANNIDFGFNISENNTLKQNLDYKLNINGEVSDKTMDGDTFELKHTNIATFYNKFAEGSNVVVNEKLDDRFTTSWITKDLSDKNNELILGEGEGTVANGFNIPYNTSLYEKYIYYAKFINKIKTGKLSVSKNIQALEDDNLENYKDELFNFKVTFTSILGTTIDPINYNGKYYVYGEGIDGELEKEAENIDGNYIIQLKPGQTAEIRDIPINTKYKIEEILGDKYEVVSINGKPGNGNSIIEGEITSTTDVDKVTYINKKKLRDIKLIKVDSSDSNIKLQGAEFTLNKLKEDGNNDESFEQRVVTSDENGQAYFKDLPYGKYVITEVKSPEGYQLLKEPIIFEINESNKAVISIEIKNRKNITLPVAGSSGTIKFNYIGIMLIGLATIIYLVSITRKKKYKVN